MSVTAPGVGRALSTLADLTTIVLAWLLARRVFGLRTAHLTALLLSLTVLHIQLAHFFAVDTFATCFAAAALLFGQRAWQRDSLLDALLAGVMVGLATASKVSALLLLPVLGLALVWPRRGWPSVGQFFDGVTAFGVTAVGAFFAGAAATGFFKAAAFNVFDAAAWDAVAGLFADLPAEVFAVV